VKLHSDLPIHRVAYGLFDVVIGLIRNMPRDVKGVIGGELRDEALKVLVLICRANASRDKGPHIDVLKERLQVIELLLRVSRDKRFISNGQYGDAIQLTDNIGKQASGWKKKFAPASVA